MKQGIPLDVEGSSDDFPKSVSKEVYLSGDTIPSDPPAYELATKSTIF